MYLIPLLTSRFTYKYIILYFIAFDVGNISDYVFQSDA